MSENRPSLVFHSEHRRHVRGGCVPVFLLLALACMAGLMLLVSVEMEPPVRPAGEGNVLYRKDQFLEAQIRQRSPLPLILPRYIAPLRQDEGVLSMPLREELKAAAAPEESPFPSAPDSVVLNRVTLLELPPEEGETADKAADSHGGEVEP